jgi:DNA-binding beta-propeller fold protein YncE
MPNKSFRSLFVGRAAVLALSLLGVLTVAGSSRLYAASVIGVVQATFGSKGQLYWWDVDLNPMPPGVVGAGCEVGTCPGDPNSDPSTFLDKLPGQFEYPYDVAIDSVTGDIFVADTYNHRIQVFDSTYQPLHPPRAFGGFGTAAGRLNFPHAVAFDAKNGRVIVADTFNNRIQAFLPDGTPANVFGGTNVIEGFLWPFGVAVDPSGQLFVVDSGHHRVEVFSPSGAPVRTIGLGTEGHANGQFDWPWSVEATADRVLVADQMNNRIQVFANDASNTFLFHIGQHDDPLLEWPLGVAVGPGPTGTIYVTDTNHHQVKAFSATTGEQLYVVGTPGQQGSDPGSFFDPVGLTVDADGRIYVADTQNHRVQVLEEPVSDTTAPTTTPLVSGTPVGGWYRGAVTVTLNATDNAGGSGVDHIRYQYTIGAPDGVDDADVTVSGATAVFPVITNGPLIVRYWAVDRQGNVEPQQTHTINFDQQPPTVGFDGPFPAANSNGWYRTNVTFRPRFADGESGMLSASHAGVGPIDLLNPAVVITGQGTGLTATVTASDRAGWTTTAVTTPPVNIDRTGPEAYNQFSRTQLDVLVYGRDALSGAPAGAATPTVYPIRWGRHHERDHEHDDWCDEDGRGVAELRTYRVKDRAGNQVSLVEMVKKEGKEIKVYVIGLRYEDADGPGRFIFFWNARKSFQWSVDKNGSLKSLAQIMEVGKDRGRQRVQADYDARNNRTTITIRDGGRERKETRTGLVLLRMVSDNGKMVIEY